MSIPAAAALEVTGSPELLTNLFQLRHDAERNVRVIHPFRVVVEVVDVDMGCGVMVARDATGIECIRIGITNREIGPGAIVCLEGSGSAVKLEGVGLAVVPGAIVDNDGVHPFLPESGEVFLEAGMHPIRLEWFNKYGEVGCTMEYEGPEVPRQRIPGRVLSRAVVDPATHRTNFVSGLDYRCYEGVWDVLPDFQELKPVKTGVATNFDLGVCPRPSEVGLEFSGFISVRKPGIYTFHLTSDDGSRWFVGQPFASVRLVRKAEAVTNQEVTPSGLLETKARSWVTLEGTISGAGVWDSGGESHLRMENTDIRIEVFESRDFVPGILVRHRVRVSGIYENVLGPDSSPVPGRLLVLSWKAVKPSGAELRAPESAQGKAASQVSPAAQPSATNAPSILETAAEIKALPVDVAKRELPVSIRGVVITSVSKHTGVVIQDLTGGVFVEVRGFSRAEPLQRGELCQVDGVTGPGLFAPMVVSHRITRLGWGSLPKPLRPTRDQFSNGSLDTEYAEIDGVVTDIQDRRLTLFTQDEKISVELVDYRPEALRDFGNAVIRIRGCVLATFNSDTRKLEAGSLTVRSATIDVLRLAPTDFFDAPRKAMGELMFYDPEAAPFRRLKVAGQVIHARAGEFFLTDGTNGLYVTARSKDRFAAGDLVDAVGFLALRGNSAELKEAMIRKTGSAPLPAPTKVPADQLFQARHAGTLVQVEATLLNHWREASEQVMELQSGFLAFRARVEDGGQLISLPPSGSRLSLTGVYAPNATGTGDGTVNGFDLLLSSPAGIRVLTTPPWWTLKRMLILAGVLAAGLLAVLIWNKELHSKVEERGRQLEAEVRHRQQAELQHAAEAERARIARDLHDELGTGLTEVSLLASAGLGQIQDAEKLRNRFNVIAEKARALVSGLDVIVWAIDPKRNSLQSFADYLNSYARELFSTAPIDCRLRVRIEHGAVVLSEAERHSLFLAVKETLNNVIRHASATEVELHISQAGDRLVIAIADNGRGFDWNSIEPGNGLANLRDRLQAMRGECHVESQPGKGTTVRFVVPIPDNPS
ncbi:MAG TPA: ATP-binding protein [Candidatus Paceibacterota bacterium]|nr:ATP-binding protein [Candidatus Paceibacterota bacterium]